MPERKGLRKELLKGFHKFRNKYYQGDNKLMPDLAQNGANPDFFIIHCIDPRSGANMVFDADPGKLFGDRVMAALVPPYQQGDDFAASLSFAVKHKKVKHIIIMGHTKCGGIAALVNGEKDKDISSWMGKAQDAFKKAKQKVNDPKDMDALCAETEKQAIIMGLKNLMTYPAVKDALKKGEITINGWLFNLEEGAIYGYDPTLRDFVNMTSPPKKREQKIQKRL